jgi:hypothetical protein
MAHQFIPFIRVVVLTLVVGTKMKFTRSTNYTNLIK